MYCEFGGGMDRSRTKGSLALIEQFLWRIGNLIGSLLFLQSYEKAGRWCSPRMQRQEPLQLLYLLYDDVRFTKRSSRCVPMWGTTKDGPGSLVYPEPLRWLKFNPVFGYFSVREGVFYDFAFFGVGGTDMKPCKVFHEFEIRDAPGLDLRRIGEPGELFLARGD